MQRIERHSPAPTAGIVHLGAGAFFRAHLAIYTEDAIALTGGNWGIIGVSLHSPSTRDVLLSQQCSYTSLQLNPGQATARQVDVISNVLYAPENPQAVLDQMAHPDIRIVSLTITEKGYCLEPSSGTLDVDHPSIKHDLANPLPVSAPGFIVRALALRWTAGHPPFTVLSCDNLPANGRTIRQVVLALAGNIDPELAQWIETNGCFPSTMVDRITPATTADDIETVRALTGLHDAAPVVHEPFSQWVIEDCFVDNKRPDWASAGAQLVTDVRPYELMKLRMLNATHSAMAYLGYLAGFKTIADTVADKQFNAFIHALWQHEIIPCLTPPPGMSLQQYANDLMSRYENPGIQHLTWQIAMDGSQKLPQRILGTVTERLDQSAQVPGMILVIAAWMRYVAGMDESGKKIDVRDPFADRFTELSASELKPADWAGGLLAMREIFPGPLADRLSIPVSQTYTTLARRGAKAMIQDVLDHYQS